MKTDIAPLHHIATQMQWGTITCVRSTSAGSKIRKYCLYTTPRRNLYGVEQWLSPTWLSNVVDAGCLDPDCIWKPDDSRRWTITNNTGSRAAFASITLPPGSHSASLYSPYYQQISIQCVLEFAYRLNSAPHSSIVVTTEFLPSEEHIWKTVRSKTFREEKDYYTKRPRLGRFEAGHFTQPVRLRIECRSETSGGPQMVDNSTMTECQLGKIVWDEECTAGSSPLSTCELDSKLCDVPGHIWCMDDALCDINKDCPNGSDEDVCGEQPTGSRCDFNDDRVFCDGWTMLTVEQGKPIPEHLLQVKRPMKNAGPIHESRPGGGPFLLYSSELNRNRSLSTRDTFFTSPFYPALFNDDEKCKLRFYIVRAGVDVEWSMSVIHPLWVQGATPLKISMDEEGKRLERAWHRISTSIGPQLFPFAVQIEANWVVTSSASGNAFVAVDDISLSVECFDKASQLSPVGSWSSMVIDSCGSTGTQSIRPDKCLQRGQRSGPYQYLLIDSQQQSWTVPETLHYRIVACGAQGGSFPSEDVGNRGGCVTADIDLVVGSKLYLSIGQKGESPCDDSVRSSMGKPVLERLCEGKHAQIRLNSSIVHGAGGGGPTTVSLDSTYIVVAAGGGGAYPKEYIDGAPNNPAGGLLHSKPPGSSERFPLNAGHGLSVSSPSSQLWTCGGFPNSGGVALPCDPAAGGGGGYYGGAAQVRNHGLGGTNWLGINASRHLLQSGVHVGDGLVTIYACRLECPSRSTCFFPNLESAEQMECLCEYGETVSPTGSCAESKVKR
ncbi:hypothetical protein Y032_0187g1105 [Ancylostoma ceylanicum]|uniref:receptor protein-tyrosine kinase n=2 Tax=Ancylostoma ceylanicum TaxID=53326 RepID=A0A016SRG7_9BILA|nr:hypothetical protein Y032_0187g1105 [Ancylostoma ceylanicum]